MSTLAMAMVQQLEGDNGVMKMSGYMEHEHSSALRGGHQ